MSTDLAILAATSGHSGVDRLLRNLVPAIADLGLAVDLLGVRGHGPYWDSLPSGTRRIDLGSRHVSSALPALTRYLRRTRPTVLMSDKDRVNRVALLARRLAGVATRVAVRSGTTISVDLASRPRVDRWLQTLSMRSLYRWADAVLVPSRGAARDLAGYARLDAARVRVVPSPLVPPDLRARAAESVDHPWLQEGAPKFILGVGELCERKDFATLVRAHARLPAGVDCRLVILGEGGRRRDLERLTRELGTAGSVDLPGFRPNPFPFMARAAVVALTSRWEGFGNVLVEALALGVPVVATDCPSGPREILADGRYGRLVGVGDDGALADALAETLAHPPNSADLKEAVMPYTTLNSAHAYLRAVGLEPGAD